MASLEDLPVAIIGAGPVGLAAAAELIERGIAARVYETDAIVAANVRDWGHVRLFSPWRYDVADAAVRLLTARGWQVPEAGRSTERRRPLRPLSRAACGDAGAERGDRNRCAGDLHRKIRNGQGRDAPAARPGRSPSSLTRSDGSRRRELARAVIDASGNWTNPNPLGADGLPADGEREAASIIAYGIPDVLGRERAIYAGRTTLVVGSGHSAANVLLDLARLRDRFPGTRILWAVRNANLGRLFGGGAADELPARGELGSNSPGGGHGRRHRAHCRIRRHGGPSRWHSWVASWRDPRGASRDRPVRPPHRGDRSTTRSRHDPRIAAGTRPLAGMRQGARPADRSQRSFLRDGAAARSSRVGSPGARLLHRRRQELRAGADVPSVDGVRTGSFGGGGNRRRSGRRRRHQNSSCRRPASARCRRSRKLPPAVVAGRHRRRAMHVARPTPPPSKPVAPAAGAVPRHDRHGIPFDRESGNRRSAYRRHGARHYPDPCLGIDLLPARGSCQADRGRHRMAAAMDRRRPVARHAHSGSRVALCRRCDRTVWRSSGAVGRARRFWRSGCSASRPRPISPSM